VNKRKGKKKGKSKPSIIDDESDLTVASDSIEDADDGIFVVRKITTISKYSTIFLKTDRK
jgi:hypothetical protein